MGNNPIRFSDPTGHKETDDLMGGGTPCELGNLACQLSKKPKEETSVVTPKEEDSLIDENPYVWNVAGDLESCNSNWGCIQTIMGLYYEDLGYPLDQLVMNPPYKNPLGANELFFLEPPILMEMQSSENTRFLQILNLDFNYPYNYEPVYLETLKNYYPELNNVVEDESNWFSNSGAATHEFIYDLEGGYSSIAQVATEWEKSLWQLTRVRYQKLVIGDR